jgi:metallo-beta-lactamase family protein
MEATYGDRQHEDLSGCVEKLARVITETVNRGGKVIMPSFAINRTQELMFYLGKLVKSRKIEPVPLYVDSPMAIDVTEIFHLYPEDFDGESKKILESEQSLFHYPQLHLTRTPADSKAINEDKGPAIIVAGSGMCSGGRIKHHLFHQLMKTENTVLFTGFQAKGTLGRILIEGADEVRIFGQKVPVRARIEKINGFSAHADQSELLRWVSWIENPLKKVFLVHAEKSAADPLAAKIRDKCHTEVVIPRYGEAGIC